MPPALQVQADPPISLARSGEAVITFDSITPAMMLRSRVVQALEEAAGSDWQSVVREVASLGAPDFDRRRPSFSGLRDRLR